MKPEQLTDLWERAKPLAERHYGDLNANFDGYPCLDIANQKTFILAVRDRLLMDPSVKAGVCPDEVNRFLADVTALLES